VLQLLMYTITVLASFIYFDLFVILDWH